MSRGWAWIQQGGQLFAQSPQTWLLLSVMYVALSWLLEQLGFLGVLLSVVLAPVIVAGWLLGCHALGSGRRLTVAYFWAGFFHQTNRLLTLGALMMAALLLVTMLVVGLGGESLRQLAEQMQAGATPEQVQSILGDGGMSVLLQAFLVALIPMLGITMSMQFAPMLVVFNDVPPLIALRISLLAFWLNLAPLFVFSLVWGLSYLTVLQLGGEVLGNLLVTLAFPAIIASAYAAYRDIVPETPPEVEAEN